MIPCHSTLASNRLLQTLPPAEEATFMAACEPVPLVFGEVLVEPGANFKHAYFPLHGFISLMTCLNGGERLEVAMAGNEGMLGASLLLGVETSSLCALVQGGGTALRIEAAAFRLLAPGCPVLQRRVHRYLYVLMNQLAQTAACTHFHQIEARLARWLLMTNDRAGSNSLQLTHEFLAVMLGVRRAGITHAATALQARGLISYRRGSITVLDRAGLIEASCDCYAHDCLLYDNILGSRSPLVSS